MIFEGFEGLRLVADVRGDPSGWPVLFLHGGGQTRHAWGSTAEIVAAQGWRTVALDLRGHGDSDWAPNGDYSFTAFCADCVAVCDKLGSPRYWSGPPWVACRPCSPRGPATDRSPPAWCWWTSLPKPTPTGSSASPEFMQSGFDGFDTLEDGGRGDRRLHPPRGPGSQPPGLKKVLRQRDDRWYWHWDPLVISPGADRGGAGSVHRAARCGGKQHPRPTMLVWGLLSDVVSQGGRRRATGPDPRCDRRRGRRRRPHDRRRSK